MADTPVVHPQPPPPDRLLASVADLELEVDRLLRQGRFVEKNTTATLTHILQLCATPGSADAPAALAAVATAARQLAELVEELHEPPGYHPAHDQVMAIAVRPLIDQVFRWQQRLTGSRAVTLRLDLQIEHAEWFPARLRHILDNLIVNALHGHDPAAPVAWVSVGFRAADGGYELQVSDNGAGAPPGEDHEVLEFFARGTPARAAGTGSGLAVVKMLVEQSGGTMRGAARDGGGTYFVLSLPRYDLLDYLE